MKEALLEILKNRFDSQAWHRGFNWADVEKRLTPQHLKSLEAMEQSGGEPGVIDTDGTRFLFADCTAESPSGRRSLCYDKAALDARKQNKPQGDAMSLAAKMETQMMDESAYRLLQELQPVDTKTSSWIATPANVRKLGGALFGDCRYGRVFIYHNGADSYFGARGFRVMIWV